MEGMAEEDEGAATGRVGGGARGSVVMAAEGVVSGAEAKGVRSPEEGRTGGGGGAVVLVRSPEEEELPVSMVGSQEGRLWCQVELWKAMRDSIHCPRRGYIPCTESNCPSYTRACTTCES